jgi:hypothetical protein
MKQKIKDVFIYFVCQCGILSSRCGSETKLFEMLKADPHKMDTVPVHSRSPVMFEYGGRAANGTKFHPSP